MGRGLDATNIGRAGRNRPASLAAEMTPDAQFVTEVLTEATGKGLEPGAVADIVLDAIRTGRYFVPTMRSHATQLRERTDALLAGNLPPMPDID
jgi:hypothetical protein